MEWGEGSGLAAAGWWWEDEEEQQQEQQEEQQEDDDDDQLPVRIQREVNLLWYELSAGGRMAYLGAEAQRRLRQTLVVLAAFRTLFEHPARALRRQSAEECFRQADVNGDGQVSFAEFLRWFRESQQGRGGGGGDGGRTATGTALVPFAEGGAAAAMEGVAMRDLLRRFLAQREGEDGEGREGRGGGGGGGRSEEQVLEDLDRYVRAWFLVWSVR